MFFTDKPLDCSQNIVANPGGLTFTIATSRCDFAFGLCLNTIPVNLPSSKAWLKPPVFPMVKPDLVKLIPKYFLLG